MSFFTSLPAHYKYGIAVGIAVFFVGWSTGLGGSLGPNAIFSIVMGLFAGFAFKFVTNRKRD